MPLMRLGDFIFNTETTNFQTTTERYSWDWNERAKLFGEDSLRNSGRKAPTKTLSGTVYHVFGLDLSVATTINNLFGNQSLEQLKLMGDSGEAYSLFDGIGRNLGKWVIIDLNINKNKFNSLGIGIKQDFTLELKQDIDLTRMTVNTLLDQDVLKVSADSVFVTNVNKGIRGVSSSVTNTVDTIF